jgi:hypothetical protein
MLLHHETAVVNLISALIGLGFTGLMMALRYLTDRTRR